MEVIRKKLQSIVPLGLQQNETTGEVQAYINGDWVDSPEQDPRHQTRRPPHITSDTECDAAAALTAATQANVEALINQFSV